MLGRGGHHTNAGVVEYFTLAGVVLVGDISAGLIVEPPRRQAHRLRHDASYLKDDAMRQERGIHVPCHPVSVVGERHRGTADDEQVGYDASTEQPLAER